MVSFMAPGGASGQGKTERETVKGINIIICKNLLNFRGKDD